MADLTYAAENDAVSPYPSDLINGLEKLLGTMPTKSNIERFEPGLFTDGVEMGVGKPFFQQPGLSFFVALCGIIHVSLVSVHQSGRICIFAAQTVVLLCFFSVAFLRVCEGEYLDRAAAAALRQPLP